MWFARIWFHIDTEIANTKLKIEKTARGYRPKDFMDKQINNTETLI